MLGITYIFRGNMAEKAIKKHPKDFLYGYDQLIVPNSNIQCIVAPRDPRKGLLRKFTYILEFPFSLITKLGFPIEIYLMNKKIIKDSDVLVCVNDAIGLALLFWKAIGFYNGKIIILAQSITERLKYFKNFPFVFWFIKTLINRADVVLTLSNSAKLLMLNKFGIDPQKAYLFKFGIDINFWTPGRKKETYLLTVGNDMNRDYQTLLNAIPDDKNLKILTRQHLNIKNNNVTCLKEQTDEQLRELYRRAAAVIIPSKKVGTESSGLSVALQALACGTPVIISCSPALMDYFSGKQDGTMYYRSEDAQDLRDKINILTADSSMQATMSSNAIKTARRFTTKKMANQIETIIFKYLNI